MTLHERLIEILETTGIETYSHIAPGNPPTPYLILRDGLGVAEAHRLSIQPLWAAVGIDVMAVSSTEDGCRDAAKAVRSVLAGKRPEDGSPPLVALETGPVLIDGQPPADPRYSITLRYRAYAQIGVV